MKNTEEAIRVTTREGQAANEISLQSLIYRGAIDGPLGRFTLQQHFRNESDAPLELIYTFPLNAEMVITGFRLQINGKSFHSAVVPLETAEQEFDQAILDGDTAAYLQRHRSNVFTLNIGNLAPGEDLLVQIHLLHLLRIKGSQLRVLLPTVVGPRYIPGEPSGRRTGFGWANPTDQVPDADWITPPVSPEGVPYGTSFEIAISESLPVSVVDCPSHRIRVQRGDSGTVVSSASGAQTDRDIIVNVEFEQVPLQQAWIGSVEQDHLALFWASPTQTQEAQHQPTDYAFLIDHSGSMAHDKLEVVKRAVRLCLRKLNPGDRFTMIAFDHQHITWRDDWQSLSDHSLEAAEDWLADLRAQGGTELLPALRAALSLPDTPGRQRVLVLLTDGQVGNEAAIQSQFDAGGSSWKTLLFGIDTAINQELFQRIAEKTGGLVEFAFPGEPLEQKVNLQFERLELPALQKVTLQNISAEKQSTFPRALQPLHASDAMPYLIRFSGEVLDELQVAFQLSEGEQSLTRLRSISADPALVQALMKVYANFLIQQYEKEWESAGEKANGRHQERLKKEIVALGIQHQLQSRFTSWLAVLEREQKIEDLPRIQVIPAAMPERWQMQDMLAYARREFCKMSLSTDQIDTLQSSHLQTYNLEHIPAVQRRTSHEDASVEFIAALFLQQTAEGCLAPPELKQMPARRATIFALTGLLANCRSQPDVLPPFRSNVKRALQFVWREKERLSQKELLLFGAVLEMLAATGLVPVQSMLEEMSRLLSPALLRSVREACEEAPSDLLENGQWQAFAAYLQKRLDALNVADASSDDDR